MKECRVERFTDLLILIEYNKHKNHTFDICSRAV